MKKWVKNEKKAGKDRKMKCSEERPTHTMYAPHKAFTVSACLHYTVKAHGACLSPGDDYVCVIAHAYVCPPHLDFSPALMPYYYQYLGDSLRAPYVPLLCPHVLICTHASAPSALLPSPAHPALHKLLMHHAPMHHVRPLLTVRPYHTVCPRACALSHSSPRPVTTF